MSRRCATTSSLSLVLVAIALAAHADPLDASADALFREGRRAAEHGEQREACAKFRESQRLDPALGTLLNIALCEEALGEVASAWEKFRRVAEELPEGDERRPIAVEHASLLDRRVPHLRLQLHPQAPAATRFFLADRELTRESTEQPLLLDPGRYRIRVTAQAHEAREYEIELHEGSELEVVLEPGVAKVESAPAEPMTSTTVVPMAMARQPRAGTEPHSLRPLAWALCSGGTAALTLSAVAAALVLERKATVARQCEGRFCSEQGLDAAGEGRRFSLLGSVAFATGAAALSVGVYLLFYGSHEESRSAAITLGAARDAGDIRLRYDF